MATIRRWMVRCSALLRSHRKIERLPRLLALLGISTFLTTLPATAEDELVAWGSNNYGQSDLPAGLSNIAIVVASDSHNLVLRADGTVSAWGDNSFGQTNVPSGLSNVVGVASKANHNLALRADGSVTAWGYNNHGQITVPIGLSNVVEVAGGTFHSMALRWNGTVAAWGFNLSGQTNVPAGLSNVIAIAAGEFHCLALRSNGTVTAWGGNSYGQTNLPAGLSNVIAVSAGGYHNLALRSDGTITAWGYNTYGQATVPNGLSNVVAISAGEFHNLALSSDGTVTAWGNNTYGQTNVPVGLGSVIAVSAGSYHSLAMLLGDRPPFLAGPFFGQTVFAGTTATFLINSAAPFYQWRFEGVDLPGATNNPLVLTNVTLSQAGNYSVFISNSFGTATSISASLTVIPLVITNHPVNQTVFAGSSTSFAVGVQNFLPLTYQWRLNGTNVSGATNNPLILTNVTVSQAGNYSVVVQNSEGSITSSNALLSVIPLTITAQPTGETALIGGAVSFSVASQSILPLTYQWRLNGTNLVGATNNPLTLYNVMQNQTGDYSVVVANGEGAVTSSNAALSVIPFIITNNSASQTVLVGSTVSFGVTEGSSMMLTYQWRQNETDLPGATNNPLVLTNVTLIQSGNYSVVISNSAGTFSTSNALLTVVPLFITTQPASQTVLVGGTANFSVSCQSSLPLFYQWRFGASDLPGETNSFLVLTNIDFGHEGNYSVVVSNSAGTLTTSNALLAVVPFFITTQPASQTVLEGRTAIFSVSCQSPLPLFYQWRYGASDLPGATNSSLILTNVGFGQEGNYFVLVNNSAGAIISSHAFLTVSAIAAWGYNFRGQITVPPGLSNVLALAGGASHSLALRADGTVAAWGDDRSSQTNVPTELTNVVAVAAGQNHSIALRGNGNVSAWGDNGSGQTNVPASLSNVVAVAGGGSHSLALRDDGTAAVWGSGSNGQTNVPSGLSNVVAVAAGNLHSLALKANGTVVAWGFNGYSQTNVPIGLSNVVAIAAGYWNSLALKSDGKVVAWGIHLNGRTPVPVTVPAGLSNVVAIASGTSHSLALRTDGMVVAWGFNSEGQTNIPVGVSNVVTIASGSSHNLALVGSGPPERNVLATGLSRTGSVFTVQISTRRARVYSLEYKNALEEPNWLLLPLVAGNGGVKTLTDSAATNDLRFYRVRTW